MEKTTTERIERDAPTGQQPDKLAAPTSASAQIDAAALSTAGEDGLGALQDATVADVPAGQPTTVSAPGGAVGLRLRGMAESDVRAVTGTLSYSEDGGLLAWFVALPGEVWLHEGGRIVVRESDGEYTVDRR